MLEPSDAPIAILLWLGQVTSLGMFSHTCTRRNATISRKRSAQKSCFRCVKKKLKCDRSHPCTPCTKAATSCKYPTDEGPDDTGLAEAKAESADEVSPQIPEQGQEQEQEQGQEQQQEQQQQQQQHHYQDGPFQNSGACQRRPEQHLALVQGASAMIPDGGHHSRPMAASTFSSSTSFFQAAPEPRSMGMISPEIVSSFNTSPTNAGAEYSHPMGHFDAYLPGDFNFMPSNSAPRIVGMVEGGVDWLNLEFDSPNNADLQAQYQTGGLQAAYPNPHMSTAVAEALYNRNQQAIPAQLMPIRNQDSERKAPKSSEVQTAQQWPFDHTRNPESQKCRLPPLRDILHGTVLSNEPDNGVIIKSLIQLMSSPYLPEMDLSLDVSMMSALDLLKNSLELYFSEFHAVLPLVHIPTFQLTKVPTVTLAAMACIGAMYSDDQQGTEQSWSLSEICIQMIAYLGNGDSTNFYNSPYLIANCLHQIYSLGSGNRRLYQNADCSRGILIGCLRGMGLLQPRVSTELEREDLKNTISNENVAVEWLRWKDQEQEKRIAWSSFEYDCSLCTLTAKRGAVDLPELPHLLPCAEPLWDAPSPQALTTPQAWAALYTRLTPTARGASTAKMLRNLLAGKGVPEDLPAWSKRLCAQSIGRLLWDIKQLDIMATSEYLRLPSLAAAQRQTKSTLLQGLNTLTESMYALSSTAELIHYNADEAMDLVVHIFRTSASHSKQRDPSLSSAKKRLAAILAKNPHKARNLAWHAAQIIAVASEYLVSAPCEIMRVFMGYIFILAFAKFGPQSSPETNYASCPVRLDLSNRMDGQRTAIATWIENGGPWGIGSVESIYSPGSLHAISEEARAMLRKMRFWGLAKKFSRILESFDFEAD
ncbi:hypothetical protein CLCR_09525 [Cladophialophora carrionii]|uniref:Zn(2)-C6 fungal-type domain-containing protein n=1 Tax=Cladophialophora carrionii TaxID=86049 RepID=A0A1C1CZZ3_9EURO|nr:hypothetical protein CLCR_09525 [Cladophialophora carrionii]